MLWSRSSSGGLIKINGETELISRLLVSLWGQQCQEVLLFAHSVNLCLNTLKLNSTRRIHADFLSKSTDHILVRWNDFSALKCWPDGALMFESLQPNSKIWWKTFPAEYRLECIFYFYCILAIIALNKSIKMWHLAFGLGKDLTADNKTT